MDKVFDPTKYEPHIATAYATMDALRKGRGGISRFGSIDLKGALNFKDSTICFAEFGRRNYGKNESFIFACYNDPATDYEAISRRWLEFLLDSELSPWRQLHPYFVSTDPDVVESTGFIVYTETDCPGDLLFNFLIAARWAYEFPQNCASFFDLIDKCNLSPALALGMSTGFMLGDNRVKVLVREEGYRKEKGKYLRDAWGDKQYFPAEYRYEDADAEGAIDTRTMKRIAGEGHTFYPGFVACVGLYRGVPRVLKPGTFRERKYGYSHAGSAWDIWTSGKPNTDRWGGMRYDPIPGYDKVNLVFKDVLEYVMKHIGEAK